jgi:hypothetical protein
VDVACSGVQCFNGELNGARRAGGGRMSALGGGVGRASLEQAGPRLSTMATR